MCMKYNKTIQVCGTGIQAEKNILYKISMYITICFRINQEKTSYKQFYIIFQFLNNKLKDHSKTKIVNDLIGKKSLRG